MPSGHHVTHCRYCNKEYLCGDCITDNCEQGHNKRVCEGYKTYLRKQAISAASMSQKFNHPDSKVRAGARMLADHFHDNVLKEMTDSELADCILKELWAREEIGSRAGALLAETIERLRGDRNRIPT